MDRPAVGDLRFLASKFEILFSQTRFVKDHKKHDMNMRCMSSCFFYRRKYIPIFFGMLSQILFMKQNRPYFSWTFFNRLIAVPRVLIVYFTPIPWGEQNHDRRWGDFPNFLRQPFYFVTLLITDKMRWGETTIKQLSERATKTNKRCLRTHIWPWRRSKAFFQL